MDLIILDCVTLDFDYTGVDYTGLWLYWSELHWTLIILEWTTLDFDYTGVDGGQTMPDINWSSVGSCEILMPALLNGIDQTGNAV